MKHCAKVPLAWDNQRVSPFDFTNYIWQFSADWLCISLHHTLIRDFEFISINLDTSKHWLRFTNLMVWYYNDIQAKMHIFPFSFHGKCGKLFICSKISCQFYDHKSPKMILRSDCRYLRMVYILNAHQETSHKSILKC